MYPELRITVSPNDREHLILEGWKDNHIFARSVSERSADRVFSFYEGPPTVNGVPGIHHVFSRTLKDAICRYKTMQGFRVERKAGWDTHGLPVEIAIEKELGFRHKREIELYGVDKFNELCRRSVYAHIGRDGGWNELTERMAYWVDLDHPYITCTNDYVESVWWALKKFHDEGLIYKGHKIQPYCPRCETPLSSHEVSLGYDTAKDPSVFVKFKRRTPSNADGIDEFFLAWTTTPWTLISNVALAVNPTVEYATVINTRKDHEPKRLILAKALLSQLDGEVEIVEEYLGATLEGQEYERLFDYIPVNDRAFYVVLGDHVTTEDGTGIVHTAPAFGEEDYNVGTRYGLPVLNPVDKSGNFLPLITDFAGTFVKQADPDIIDALKRRGIIYRKGTIEHTYPFCWRCDSPLLYYARDSWYIRVTAYREKLVEQNKTVNWNPPEIGEGRFGNWLEDLKDWSISRERFWGTPLPVWVCDGCQKERAVGSFADLATAITPDGRTVGSIRQTTPDEFDPHKPFVDNLTFTCDCGGTMRRTPEVIDVWFDSGSMPFAQFHYPFENVEQFERCFPAQYISEGVDQTRGWFYTLAAINTFLFGRIPYENVIVNDMLLDRNGQKMSKSRGNVLNPFEILGTYGADATRWYLLSAAVPSKPRSFNTEELADVERKLFGTLLHTYGFFAMYANIDGYTYTEANRIPETERPEIDRWVLSVLHSLIRDCTDAFEKYDLTRGTRALQDFILEQLSNWYVRRNRRRFWKGNLIEAGVINRDKQAAFDTLYECLTTIAKLMAPYAPFFPEWLFGALQSQSHTPQKQSVHLEHYPNAQPDRIDAALEARMAEAQRIASLVRQMRERAAIKVRQPLDRILIPVTNRYETEQLRMVEAIICDEVNVRHIEFVQAGDSDVITLSAKANFKRLGARLGKQMKAVAQRIAAMTQDEIRDFQRTQSFTCDVDGTAIELTTGDLDITAQDVEGWLVSSEAGRTVALDTHLTDELRSEGLARELVSRIQNLRKESGFDVTDRIAVTIATDSAALKAAMMTHETYIREETLATGSFIANTQSGTTIDLGEATATIAISRE